MHPAGGLAAGTIARHTGRGQMIESGFGQIERQELPVHKNRIFKD